MKFFYIIGNPTKHSLSPKIFNYIFEKYNIDAKYLTINAKSNKEFQKFIRNTDKDYFGLNITLPYKKLAYDIVENIDKSAINIGSINCIKKIGGDLVGYNTDQYGFIKMINKLNINFNDYNILILGNGGSARAIAHTFLNETNQSIFVWGRNSKHVTQFTDELNAKNNMMRIYNKEIDKPLIVINCISLNIDANSIKTILSYLPVQDIKLFIDLNYFTTPLIREVKRNNINVLLGLDMFIYQALKSFEIWFGNTYPDKIMYNDLMEIIK